jgi:oligopeptide/dipeptide ABC transporter ATP-binding protein
VSENLPPVLAVEGLRVGYPGAGGRPNWAVDGVDLAISRGERVGIVGESGSGKSSLALSCLGLARGAVVRGTVAVEGVPFEPSLRAMRRVRGSVIGLVLQDPLSALNPVITLGRQLEEVLTVRGVSRSQARARAVELLDRVGVADAARRLNAYPREFSGGMRQRVVIAMALMAGPRLLIADEPTTALDVRNQQKVLDLLRELCDERQMALMLISHDIGVVSEIADRTVMFYAGRLVEEGATGPMLSRPAHPYTAGLIASRPRLTGPIPDRLPSIAGSPPRPGELAGQCRFSSRCRFAADVCRATEPELRIIGRDRHRVACHLAESIDPSAVPPPSGQDPAVRNGAPA